MSKIPEYPLLTKIDSNDLLIIEGSEETHSMTIGDFLKSELVNAIINELVEAKLNERIGKYTFHYPPITQETYDQMSDHGTQDDIYIVLEDENDKEV